MTREKGSHRAAKQKQELAKALIAMFRHNLPEVAQVSLVAAYSISVAILALQEELS